MKLFRNRTEAAWQLAEALVDYRGRNPLVLGIPRGAVPMAAEIAMALEGDVDVVLAHKIPHPANPELAIGSVGESGRVWWTPGLEEMNIPLDYLDEEAAVQAAHLRRHRFLLSQVHYPLDPAGRIAIVVDDGAATGATTVAALREVRSRGPKELVAAVAVASPEAVGWMKTEADRVVALATPIDFFAVAEFYEDFSQVSERDVLRILADAPAGKISV